MVETLTSEANVKLKAGANVNTSLTSGNYTEFINEAEAWIMGKTRIDWVSKYSTLNTTYRKLLDFITSSLAAMAAINYDMSGYTSRVEAQTMLDFNYTRVQDGMRELKEKYTQDFIQQT